MLWTCYIQDKVMGKTVKSKKRKPTFETGAGN